jgi:SEC-C motif-containing protein
MLKLTIVGRTCHTIQIEQDSIEVFKRKGRKGETELSFGKISFQTSWEELQYFNIRGETFNLSLGKQPMKTCPCDSRKIFEECCGPYLEGKATPETAEALMRSRYSAYVQKDHVYLLSTWHESSRPTEESLDMPTDFNWTGLEILATEEGGSNDAKGTVEFVAHYHTPKISSTLHEKSRFLREEDQWFYVDGDTIPAKPITSVKVGRNEPCPCGSGKKYKKCCL